MTDRNLLLTVAAASLGLAACDRNSGPPAPAASLTPAQEALAEAPFALPLPPAAPLAARRATRGNYRYVDDAYAMSDAFGDSPPDYVVDYQGERPWIWRARNGAYRVVEWTPDGERDYYYRSGANRPFLVRDPRNAYAYEDGRLVEVYDAYGRPVSADRWASGPSLASQYLIRAAQLYLAAQSQQRQAADAAEWRARRDTVDRQRQAWAAEQQRNDDWRRWRTEDAQPRQQAVWTQERAVRQAAALAVPPRDDRQDERRREQANLDAQRQQQAEAQHRDQQRAQELAQVQARAQEQARQAAAADRERQQQVEAQRRDRQQAQQRAEVSRRQAEIAQRQDADVRAKAQERAQAEQARAQQQAQQKAEVSRRQAEVAQRQEADARAKAQERAQAEQARAQQQAQRQQQQLAAEQARVAAKAAQDQAQQAQAKAKEAQVQAEAAAQHAKSATDQAPAAPKTAPAAENGKGRGPKADHGKPEAKEKRGDR